MSVEPPRVCEGCGRPIAAWERPNKRHCNDTCRQSALRARRRELRAEDRDVALSRFGLDPARERALLAALDEPRLVALVAREAPTHWRAAAFLLERQYPERWAARPRPAPAEDPAPDPDSPWAEVDELARARRRREERDQ